MKKMSVTLFLLSCIMMGKAQNGVPLNLKIPSLEKSPLEMAYFPSDYPMLKTQSKVAQTPLARVIYSRPQKDNRVIFGDLVAYNKIWRLGANEATELELFKDATIGGKKIPKGRYTLYAIPTASQWTIIINKETDTWGAFVYDQKKDVLRINEPVQALTSPADVFTMSFEKRDAGTNLIMAWENVSVSLQIDVR